jgi:hypothetical protein
MIYFLFFFSILFNVFLLWYLYRFLERHAEIVSLVDDIQNKFSFFKEHLESIYGLETFYGEPVIQNLIEHSKTLLLSFEQFNEDYELLDEKEDEDEQVS